MSEREKTASIKKKRALLAGSVILSLTVIAVIFALANRDAGAPPANPTHTVYQYNYPYIDPFYFGALNPPVPYHADEHSDDVPYGVTFHEPDPGRIARGYTSVVRAIKPDFSMSFYFRNVQLYDLLEIEAAVERWASIFYSANKIFPTADNFNFVVNDGREVNNKISPRNLPMAHLINAGSTSGLVFYYFFQHIQRRTGLSAWTVPFRGCRPPAWLASGIEDYLLGGDGVQYLTSDELAVWLSEFTENGSPPFGDYWFINNFWGMHPYRSAARNVAYTIVRDWSDNGLLLFYVELALEDNYRFQREIALYICVQEYEGDESAPVFFYRFRDIEVITPQGRYWFMYIPGSRPWTVRALHEAIEFLDTADIFLRDFFHVSEFRDRSQVHIYTGSVPLSRYGLFGAGMHVLGQGFAQGSLSVVGNASLGIAFHEMAHAHLYRGTRPPPWLEEGMAVLSDIKWYESSLFRFPLPGRADSVWRDTNRRVVYQSCMARLPRQRAGLPFGEILNTYSDAGSFVRFLYNRFGMESLLEFYPGARQSGPDRLTEQIFGKTMDELIYAWQEYLLEDIGTIDFIRRNFWLIDEERLRAGS